MAGLGRSQGSRYGLGGVLTALGALFGMNAQAKEAGKEARKGSGHPIHAKVLKGKLDGCPAGYHCRHRAHCQHHGEQGDY